jgi:hypothetical protein
LTAVRLGEVEAVGATEMTRLYRKLKELLELNRLAEVTALKKIETTDPPLRTSVQYITSSASANLERAAGAARSGCQR